MEQTRTERSDTKRFKIMELYGIHKDCPIIWSQAWDDYKDQGWRWECNLDLNRRSANILGIRSLQRRYGEENVTIGHPWNSDKLCPFVSIDAFGIYIRDVEILVDELYKWMVDMEAMTDIDVEFCIECGKILREYERPGPECEFCEYAEPYVDWEDDLDV